MTITIYVSRDAAALAVDADGVAAAIAGQACALKADVQIVRNGSRGLLWLEPLVEVQTDAGRIAYGPVRAEDVPSLFDAGFLHGGAHALRLGITEEIPEFERQQRLSFARCGLGDPLAPVPWLGLKTALALAHKVASNAPLSNFAVMHALPRIAEQGQAAGLLTESLMAAIAQADDAAKGRMREFLDGKSGKVGK